ncbi:DUF1800 domain-containing protein [Loktanella sp. SALINAS62]|uniref:DUF1800 domain-containing protein n=1 Tax=Loktanella sp. SALINAS62 TaxID=2706124 RepID=UPI001B8D0D42|nr:DUF1800 domain-containing protein [Loktanella sp. SALINAS62]MBS1304004.1 DUF1800 domain-containing protein [Loktanella sp. SALINAS62]
MTASFDPIMAATRFGIGLSPHQSPPASVNQMLQRLTGRDDAAARFPISGMDDLTPSLGDFQDANAAKRAAGGTPREDATVDAARVIRRAMSTIHRTDHLATIARGVSAADGLRERLTHFWADHFTVKAKNFGTHYLIAPFVQDAIRPHVVGRFSDMLKAVTFHPAMLMYLDQVSSSGPNSVFGQRTGRGLNENLARELLELHLVGPHMDFSQTDVTELAELLTGLQYQGRSGFAFRADRAEPGAEVVLGRRYSADATLRTIEAALEDLATRPEVARHIATKLAVHFVSDTPDPNLIATMESAFYDTGGDLAAVCESMLTHPLAWSPVRAKVRRPDIYMMAAWRALGITGEAIMTTPPKVYDDWIRKPMAIMAQPYLAPVGPDGWAEDPTDWITPQGLAGRINWAIGAPAVFSDPLPDPRDFVNDALGPRPPAEVVFAASAAETRADGIGIVLSAPAFQRI